MADEDLYSVLGVSKSAGKDEIKKAYRKLARELHPDKNKDNKEAEERFKKVSAAYAVLGDDEKRKMYDQYGIDGLRDGFDPNMWNRYGAYSQAAGQRESSGFDFNGRGFDFGGFQGFGAMEDIFEGLFGGKRGRGRAHRTAESWPPSRKGHQVRSSLEVDLLDAVLGRELEIVIPIEGEKKKLRVKIPEGIEDKKTIRLKEQGAKSPTGGVPGDLLLEIKIKKGRVYERDNLNLIKKEKLTVREAYEGTQKEIETPWGTVKMTVPPGTQGGSRLRLKGKGVKKAGEQGDLYIQILIHIPTRRDETTKEAVEKLEKCY